MSDYLHNEHGSSYTPRSYTGLSNDHVSHFQDYNFENWLDLPTESHSDVRLVQDSPDFDGASDPPCTPDGIATDTLPVDSPDLGSTSYGLGSNVYNNATSPNLNLNPESNILPSANACFNSAEGQSVAGSESSPTFPFDYQDRWDTCRYCSTGNKKCERSVRNPERCRECENKPRLCNEAIPAIPLPYAHFWSNFSNSALDADPRIKAELGSILVLECHLLEQTADLSLRTGSLISQKLHITVHEFRGLHGFADQRSNIHQLVAQVLGCSTVSPETYRDGRPNTWWDSVHKVKYHTEQAMACYNLLSSPTSFFIQTDNRSTPLEYWARLTLYHHVCQHAEDHLRRCFAAIQGFRSDHKPIKGKNRAAADQIAYQLGTVESSFRVFFRRLEALKHPVFSKFLTKDALSAMTQCLSYVGTGLGSEPYMDGRKIKIHEPRPRRVNISMKDAYGVSSSSATHTQGYSNVPAIPSNDFPSVCLEPDSRNVIISIPRPLYDHVVRCDESSLDIPYPQSSHPEETMQTRRESPRQHIRFLKALASLLPEEARSVKTASSRSNVSDPCMSASLPSTSQSFLTLPTTPSSDHHSSLASSEPRASLVSEPKILTLVDGTTVAYRGSTILPSVSSQYDTRKNVQGAYAEFSHDTQVARNAAVDQDPEKRKRMSDHHSRLRPFNNLSTPPTLYSENQEKALSSRPARRNIVRKIQTGFPKLWNEGAEVNYPKNPNQSHSVSERREHAPTPGRGAQQSLSQPSNRQGKRATGQTANRSAYKESEQRHIMGKFNELGFDMEKSKHDHHIFLES